VNSFVVPVVRYTGGIINWTVEDCMILDHLTHKQLTLFKALHPRADVYRLYVPHCSGGRGLFSIYDTIQLGKSSLLAYTVCHKSEEPIMKQVKQHLLSQISWNPELTKSITVFYLSMFNSGNTSLYMDSGPVYCKTKILNHLCGGIQPISSLLQKLCLQQLRIKPFALTGWLVILWELLAVIYVGDVDCSQRLLNTLWPDAL